MGGGGSGGSAAPKQFRGGKKANLDPETVTLLVFLHEAIPGGIEREARAVLTMPPSILPMTS